MKEMKRVLALVLALVMVVGLLPVYAPSAEAAETPLAAAIFASDIHEENTGLTGSGTSAMKSLLSTIGANGVTYNTIGFVGDTFTDIAGKKADMTSAAQTALGQSAEVYYAYGDHDEESDISSESGLLYSGSYYYIYHISDMNMRSKAGATSTNVEAAISAFETAVSGMDKTKVLFIMSHVPLHDRRDDNTYANDWYTAITAVAKEMDVVFFWAHNHTEEDEVDQAAYYVAKNGTEKMTIYGGSSVTPNFTYMNAGYIYAAGQNPSRKGVATTVEIYADTMVFQDYNSSGKYTDSSYSHNVTVTREFASKEVTLSSIAISGKTAYYVGDELALTVTATYSDGTTADVTADATLSGYDMSTAGTYTVTATYDEKTATADITVTAVQINYIAVTTQPTKLTYITGEALDTTGMVVTATYNNGTTAEVTGWYTSTVDMTTAGEKTVTVNYAVNGTTYQTTFTITVEEGVAEGVTLSSIAITTPPTKTEYLLSEELKLDGMVVMATFSDGSTKEIAYKPFSTSTVYGGYELDNFSMYVEKAHEVKVTYTFGDVTCTATTTINVWNEDFADENTGVSVHVTGDYGVTAASVAESANENVATAVTGVISGENYVAYDISLTFDAGYSETNTTKTVTLPIPDGVNNPVVYYVSADGETVTNMGATKDGKGNVTFETTHFSTYVIGESAEIEVPENQTATGEDEITTSTKKTVYVLSSGNPSGNVLIANSATAGSVNLVANDGGDLSNSTATVVYGDCDGDGDSEYYIELTDATNELWTVSGSYTFENQDEYLRYNNGLSVSSTSTIWSYSSNRLSYRSGKSTYYLRYNNGWTTTSQSNSATSIYFYKETEVEVETTTTVSGTYSIEGKDISVAVSSGSTANLTSTLTFTPESGTATTTDTSTTASYEIVTVDKNGNTVDGDPNDIISKIENGVVTFTGNYGTALVKVSYTTDFGTVTDYITIEAKAPYYTINLHKAELTKVSITEFAEGVTYYTFDSTTNTYNVADTYEEGTTYYTTPVIQGDEITAPIALKGIEAGDTYAVWAVVQKHTSAGAEDMGSLGDKLHWSVSDESIATIDTTTGVITFTGKNYGTFQVTVSYEGDDGKVITDTITISVTDSLYIVPGDGTNDFPEYPDEGAVRFDKTANAVGNFSQTGIAQVELSMTGVPYTTGAAIDALLVLDMSTSMKTEVATDTTRYDVTAAATKAFIKTIVQNDDGTYNNNTVCVHYFNGTTAYTDKITSGFITISSDAELQAIYDKIDALVADPPSDSGTDYSTSMKAAYDAIIARDAVSDNTQALVFMSDGGPTYYTYVDGTSSGTVSNDASTIVGWFDTDDNDTSSDETDDTATPNSSFKNEYYSTLLKNAGYPVYTVGLGLAENSTGPQAFTGLTSGAHEAITSYILSSMATNSSYFYNVADSDAVANMGNIFSGIAASIKEAATDVVVEDKIDSHYSVNFSMPTGVTTDEADGMSQFYIQVVDYVLDATTHERTGVYTVLENFTFDANGALVSHTVDGVACTDCAHVTTVASGISKIDGTYFDYTREQATDAAGNVLYNGQGDIITEEYLTWNADKLTSTELALQYFVYLDNSVGYDADKQVDPGTYPTNEYATLTYTNYQGNRVQQEYPIPTMTWMGAKVTYVFYLVNSAGQPVNRAGRVVPFAEAVYVTTPVTYDVTWNEAQNIERLSADYLAENLVPKVYELFDTTAYYEIRVYQDETVNQNYFKISGATDKLIDSVMDSDTTVDNSTTKVFNTKAGVKYDKYGIYSEHEAGTTLNTTDASGNPTTVTTNFKANDIDYANTTVAFAVVWKPQLAPDVVVVDYGLDVLIDVTTNDTMAAGLVGVRTDVPSGVTSEGTYTRNEDETKTTVDVYIDADNDAEGLKELKIGTASVENLTFVRFSLDEDNGMQFSDAAEFYYESDVNFYDDEGDLQTTSMYSSVTVIPATTIYYEDSFVTYSSYEWSDSANTWVLNENEEESLWSVDGTTTNATQAQDRPGDDGYDIVGSGLDADNIYGYDAAYANMSVYSLGSAKKATVDYDHFAQAQFTFYGTGFDIISMTSNDTGVILVDVEHEVNGTWEEFANYAVDTYYGYTFGECHVRYDFRATYDENGNLILDESDEVVGAWFRAGAIHLSKDCDGSCNIVAGETALPEDAEIKSDACIVENAWIAAPNGQNPIYQVPVIKMANKDYGHYRVTIKATYDGALDHKDPSNDTGEYDFYLDAIRIYDPANDGANNEVIKNAYTADGEGWPSYIELRNNLIAAATLGSASVGAEVEGMVFIDGDAEVGDAQIADYISYGPNNEVYLAEGQSVAFKLATPDNIKNVHIGIKSANGADVAYTINGEAFTVKTSTDMYYDLTKWMDETIVITNTSESILSITNIKSTYTSAPSAETQQVNEPLETYIYMTPEAAELVLMAMKPEPVNPFADVMKSDFYYDAVLWAVENGITNGVTMDHFGPFMTCNRAQVVTFLWRAAGSPAPVSRVNPFVDVPNDSWYTDAVLWAVENGITNGLTADTFGPNALCNRAQVVTFLWRANGSVVCEGENPFVDVADGSWYANAVLWAVKNGITNGASADAFDPNGTCMRAHVVTFLYRAAQLPEHSES